MGIAFFGTPHGGADLRKLAYRVLEFGVRALGFAPNDFVIRTLLPDSEKLNDLRAEFGRMAHIRKWKIISFQESLAVRLLGGAKVSQFHSE
jgi:hypothetical protein